MPEKTVREQLAEALGRIKQLEDKQAEANQVSALVENISTLDRKIERVLSMVCPVCGPKIVDEMHPEIRREVREVAASISGRNGHSPAHSD